MNCGQFIRRDHEDSVMIIGWKVVSVTFQVPLDPESDVRGKNGGGDTDPIT